MVGEFPELQGVIGGYLARAQGQPEAVANAIRDHYKPAGQGDDVPTAPVTVAVSLADKLDTLVSFFVIGERPTGSKDPFALRRAALGLIDLIVENGLRLSVRNLTAEAYRQLLTQVTFTKYVCDWDVEADSQHQRITEGNFKAFTGRMVVLMRQPTDWVPGEGPEETYSTGPNVKELVRYVIDDFASVVEKTCDYLFDRLEERQKRVGRRYDLVQAILPKIVKDFAILSPFNGTTLSTSKLRFHNYGVEDDLVRLLARVKALQAFVETPEGTDLLAGYKRASNILKKENYTPSPQGGEGRERGAASSAKPAQAPQKTLSAADAAGPSPSSSPPGGEGKLGLSYTPESEEAALIAALDAAAPRAAAAIAAEDFEGAMAALASLRAPVDSFFDKVTVNDPDPAKREARLALLAKMRDAVHRVADFSRIEG